jgi:hypothetical protein
MEDRTITHLHYMAFGVLMLIASPLFAEDLLDPNRLVELIRIAIRVLETVHGPMPHEPHGLLQAVTVPIGTQRLMNGDLHGDIASLESNLADMHDRGYFQSDDRRSALYYKLEPGAILICCGDNGDRGYHSVEVWQLLLKLLIANPRSCFLIRGNHETPAKAENADADELCLMDELYTKYQWANVSVIFDYFKRLWEQLPSVLFVGEKDAHAMMVSYMIAVHGALEPSMMNLYDQLLRRSAIAATGTIVSLAFCDSDMKYVDPEVASFYKLPPTLTENSLLWGDINPIGQESSEGRFDHVFSLNVRHYLPRLCGAIGLWCWRTLFMVRGHQHRDGGVLANTEYGFEPLEHGVKREIKPLDVFTITSSPEGLFYLCEDAYAIVASPGERWSITPSIRTVKKNFGCSRVDDQQPLMQRLVIDATLRCLVRLSATSLDPMIKFYGILVGECADKSPGAKVQMFVNPEQNDWLDFWEVIRGCFKRVSSKFWRMLLHQELDQQLADARARLRLRNLVTSARLFSDDSEVAMAARPIEDTLRQEPFIILTDLIEFYRYSAQPFWCYLVRELKNHTDPEADRLRALLPAEIIENEFNG